MKPPYVTDRKWIVAGSTLLLGAVYYSGHELSGSLAGIISALAASAIAPEGFDHQAFLMFFATLFAIMNPVIAVPKFLEITGGQSAGHRNRLALTVSLAVFITLVVAALFGKQLLALFAIDISAFRISGGIILVLMGLAMVRSKPGTGEASAGCPADDNGRSEAICPVAIPLLAGPGAIAAIIVQSQTADKPADALVVACAIAAIVVLIFGTLRFASSITRRLGPAGLVVTTRIVGMFVAAIAVDMMITGLKSAFAGLL